MQCMCTGTILVLGGYQGRRKDAEILDLSKKLVTCTKPAEIPDIHSKGAIGAYFTGKVVLCGGSKSDGRMVRKRCHEYTFLEQQWTR